MMLTRAGFIRAASTQSSGLTGTSHDNGKKNPYRRNFLHDSENTMITSKLTSKAQTTIPQVRAALHLREGDELIYVIEEKRVILTKARADRAMIRLQPSRNGTAPIEKPMTDFKPGDVIHVPFPI